MRYLIIGNGVAGTTAAAAIRKQDSSGEITILTEESLPFYSRIQLIGYLAGEVDEQRLIVYQHEWYEKQGIHLLMNAPVSDIDKDRKEVVTADGRRMGYDRLLLATGARSFVPPIQGVEKKGIFTLRTVADAQEIIRYAGEKKNILLIGGGVLGLEAGNSLRKRRHRIKVVEFFPRLLPRQMDPEGAEILKAQMEDMGFVFYLGAKSKEILGDKAATGLLLEDGTEIDGDLIIISAGVRPQAELAGKLGLTVQRGLVVNDRMETEIEDIFAAGDLIQHNEICYGIWQAAQAQGEVAGTNMGGGDARYRGTTMSNLLKVVGIDLAAAGDIDADGKLDMIVHKDKEKYIYKKLVLRDNILVGTILYGDITGYRRILRAIQEQKNVAHIRDALEKWDTGGL